MEIKKVTIAGAGVLGSQIAFQTAFNGFDVTIYEINEETLFEAKNRLEKLATVYGNYFNNPEKAEKTLTRFSYETDLQKAVKDTDLVIEAIPEIVDIKIDFYQKLAKVAPEKTIFASNSSTLLPSQFAVSTERPEKYLHLHFANEIWKNNVAEIMGHAGTEQQYLTVVEAFARAINMIPFRLNKEQPGYILNTLLVPFLSAAQHLWANDIANPHDIDKNWMISTGAPLGPFAILDVVGMTTPYNLMQSKALAGDKQAEQIAEKIKTEMIDKGKMGVASGEGFYQYPNPAYAAADFLK